MGIIAYAKNPFERNVCGIYDVAALVAERPIPLAIGARKIARPERNDPGIPYIHSHRPIKI
jgi:hypothetical protein